MRHILNLWEDAHGFSSVVYTSLEVVVVQFRVIWKESRKYTLDAERPTHSRNIEPSGLEWNQQINGVIPNVEKMLQKYDIILPIARHWRVSNTQQYGDYHIAKDWEMLRQIIKERSPQYIPAFEKTMDHSNKSVGYNMFITHWKHFNTYSKWLFDILFEVERRVPPIADPIQSRIYGYMSERLINVFCEYNHLRIKHIPLIMPFDDFGDNMNISNWHATYRNMINDFHYLMKR